MKPYTLLLLGLLLASAAEAQTTDEARLEVTVTDAASGEALGYAVCSLRPKEGNGKERAAAADARGVCLLEGLKPGRFELRLLYMGHVFLQGELQLPAGLTRRRIRLDIDPVAIGEVLVTAAESKGPTSSSKITSVQNISFNEGEDPRPNYCIVDEILCIPGDGDDVLVKAGESLLICNNAQNHKATNPNSFDLTSADFEWYNESTVESMLDIDNPEVDNLDIWYTYTKSVIMLDAAGKRSCALAIPPIGMTRDRFLADYAFTGSYIFHSPNGKDYDMTFKNCFKVPNSWIVDAVNLGVSSEYLTNPWDTELDAGYTYACETSSDQTSYGLSVRRKVAADGKLVDTNNSTNDFTPRATPSLSEIQ